MRAMKSQCVTAPFLATLSAAIALITSAAEATTSYLYDPEGRLTVVFYDNGVCVTYAYDASGNRTLANVAVSATAPLIWGSGPWGCTPWSP
jgi:YD repeat-containing protein